MASDRKPWENTGWTEKTWNAYLFTLAKEMLDRLMEQVTEVPDTARRGYEMELLEQRGYMQLHHKSFTAFLIALEKSSSGILSQRATPLDFGKMMARKRLYSACLGVQFAALMPRDLEPAMP